MTTSASETAVTKLLQGYNCAQAVFFSMSGAVRVDPNTALRLASGFGAGMGRKQEVCGAVSGGIMVIGAKYGRGEHEDRAVTEVAYQKTRELMDRFAERHGTVICRKLLGGCELMTSEGQEQFKARSLLNTTCKPCVASVVEILENIV